MARGKQTCKILKEIRRQIAEANGIEYVTSECRYKGDCLGTCPKCEAEVRYLEQQLRARSLAGKAVALAGISAASLAMLMPISTEAQTQQECQAFMKGSIPVMTDTITVKGMVPVAGREDFHFIDLNVIDEKGNPINPDNLYIESPRIYGNGEEDTHYIHPDYVDEKHPCRIYWDAGMRDEDGKPLKEATLRIEADGYDDPVIISVKYPKRNAKKTIKFKHKKK
ncbi:hypothetical protein [uncultured Duncaniella sp.]|uniref:hypothetical protein n=1 Tax=uncultured Duncaniella sp. TaxID=2768039 RepID=UPI00267598E7|nr:hypothetical protein [uncultured Duncaniella sp.]